MRQVTMNAVYAFENQENFKSGNTEVIHSITNNATCMFLHGHQIAVKDHNTGILSIDACGWLTNTTKERLNGIRGVNIYQRQFEWYLNNDEWNGELIEVN